MANIEKTFGAPHSLKNEEIKTDGVGRRNTTFDHTKVMVIYVLGGPGAGTRY